MMIDPIYLVFSHIAAGSVGIIGLGIYRACVYTKNNANKIGTEIKRYAGIGLETEDIPPTKMTYKQHMDYLKKKYPEAWKDYMGEYSQSKPVYERTDRHILRLIVRAETNELTFKCNEYTMDFSNGDEIWITNKYSAYGNLYRSSMFPQLKTTHNSRLSPYTFLRLVDLEESYLNHSYAYDKPKIEIIE